MADVGHSEYGRPLYLHGPWVKRAILGYCILAFGTVMGLFATWHNTKLVRNERIARSVLLNRYLENQCDRDTRKDKVFINILERSIANVERSKASQGRKDAYEAKTRQDIANIKAVDRLCIQQIPPLVTR